jgi:outer membrane receptor protein involved in Fe transport
MNFRKLFLTIFVIGTSLFSVLAQTDFSGSVSGKLIDVDNKKNLDYVNVTIYAKDGSNPVKTCISATNGTFLIENLIAGDYRVEATFIGYITYKKEVRIASGQVTKLGTIMMKTDSKLLGAVEVTGLRSAMKLDIDKKVFSVDQTVAAAGASVSEVLKEIPSVSVDDEGTVSLRNSTNVTIWINGKPAGLNSENQGQVLEQMPAESIEKIEVVTNPSSKYSAEGSAGIINLVLKKDRKAGYFGSVRAGVGYPWGYNAGANFNYSSSKFDFYANLGRRTHSFNGNGTSTRQTYYKNELTNQTDTNWLNSETSRDLSMNGLFFRSGIDYHINDKHTLSLSGFGMDGDRAIDSEIHYSYLDNNRTIEHTTDRNTTSDNSRNNYEITIDYLWEIGQDHKLQTNITFGKENSGGGSHFLQTNYNVLGNPSSTSNQTENSPSSENEMEFQADYQNKISDKFKIEAGLKSDWNKSNSEEMIYDPISYAATSVPSFLSSFDYDEKISAFYGTLTGKIGNKFGYQFGLRGELTDISFSSANKLLSESINQDKNYFNLFPGIFLTYSFSEGHELQLNYSRRINRPRGHDLDPFVNITDSTNIMFGNPLLDPEYANSFELDYIKTWDNQSLSLSAYHKMNNHVIQDIRYIENGIMYQTPSNVTNSVSSGLEIVSKNTVTKKIESTGSIDLYYTSLDAFTYKDVYYKGANGFSWNARLNSTILLSNSLTAQISGFYNAPGIVAQGESSSNFSLDAGIRKSFYGKKLIIAINGRNILNSFKFENKTWGQGFYQESINKFRGSSLQLNVTWNFGNMKPQKRQNEEDDSNGSYSEQE